MTIRVTCEKCGAGMKVKDELAGTKGHCPKCKTAFLVPKDAESTQPVAVVAAAAEEAGVPGSSLEIATLEKPSSAPPSEPPADPPTDELAEDEPPKLVASPLASADEDNLDSGPLMMEPDPEDDDDDAPMRMVAKKAPDPKPEKAPSKQSSKKPFDPADFLSAHPPESRPAPPTIPDEFDEEEPARRMGGRTKPEPKSSDSVVSTAVTSASAASDVWDHTKAAKQMRKALKESNALPKEEGEPGFDWAGAFRELGLKGVGGIAAILIICYGLYCMFDRFMGGGPNLPKLGYVTGKVLLDGEPLPGASVYFAPEETAMAGTKRERARTSLGLTNDQGEYRMQYLEGVPGVAVGKCRVWLTLTMPQQPKQFIPGDHSDGAGLTREVKPGRQTFDFDMKSKR
jgi:hypothetical protein